MDVWSGTELDPWNRLALANLLMVHCFLFIQICYDVERVFVKFGKRCDQILIARSKGVAMWIFLEKKKNRSMF